MFEDMNNVVTENIGNGIQVIMEGLPQSQMTPAIQAKAALSFVKHGIPIGVNFTAGIIGSLSTATLQIGGQYYRVKFAIRALRAITALEVYSQAIQWIEFQKSYNRVDSILADETMEHLRDLCRRELDM